MKNNSVLSLAFASKEKSNNFPSALQASMIRIHALDMTTGLLLPKFESLLCYLQAE
jgi:hypothetical protein